jgi:hypothetical protein
VLNAKGGESKAKANGSAPICPKYSYCKIWSLVGENFDYEKRGSFWLLIKFFSWNISLYAQTSEFELKIGK